MKNILLACLILILILSLAGSTMLAQNTALRGKVVDDQSAVLIGAAVTVKKGNQVVAEAKTSNQGLFVAQVPPGDYSVEIAADDFETLVQPARVTANTAVVTYTMKLAEVKTEVTVQETANQLSLDPSSNLTATVLDQDFIEQLPDDTDELTAYLTQLAGPRANASGGVDFIIDGFSNGILPSKDQILQIRINNNPFSTEFVRPGFGRIEIVTKPGTGQYHGSAQFSGRSNVLDANPLYCAQAPSLAPVTCSAKPPYQRKFVIGNLSGPIVKNRLTASLNLQHQDNNPSKAILAISPFTGQQIGGFIASPSSFNNYNSRGQWSITPSQRHILNFNLQYQDRNSTNNGVGGYGLVTLPGGVTTYNGFPVDNAYSNHSKSYEVQLRETEILSGSLIHEVRYEFDHNTSATIPDVNAGPQYTINQALQFGSANNYQTTRNTNHQFANALSYTGRILSLKAGVQAQHFNNHQYSLQGFNGSYTYKNYTDFLAGNVQNYTITTGFPQIQVNQWTLGTFLQTDWKVSKKWLVSGGVRYQTQTNISDHKGLDPRASFAYQLTNSTIIRAGFGTFHQILSINTVNNLVQYDGQHQLQSIVSAKTNPDGSVTYVTPAQIALANAGALASLDQIYAKDPNLTTPYTINSAVSIEQTLSNGLALTASFDDVKGVHLFRGRDINAALITSTCTGIIISGCVRPNPNAGIMNQLEATGNTRFDSLTIGARQRLRNLNFFANYTYSKNYTDTFGPNVLPMNNYDLRADWGLSNNQVTHRIQTTVNYTFPHGILASTNTIWNTGQPFTQVQDSPGEDGNYNQRLPGVPINSFSGHQQVNVGLNVNKTFILREGKGQPQRGNNRGGDNGPGGAFGRGAPGGGGRGGPGGGGPGGFGGGRGGGPGFGGLPPGGVSMTVFANTFNTINYTNLNNPSGTIGTPYYLIPTQKSNPRIVELGIRFNF